MASVQDEIIERLEALPFPEARKLVLGNHYGHPGSRNQTLCEAWLAAKEAEARDAAEAESLSISRRALSQSELANLIATVALIVSAVTAFIVVVVQR